MASFVTGKLENVEKNQNEWRFGTNSEAERLCTIQRLDDEWNFKRCQVTKYNIQGSTL